MASAMSLVSDPRLAAVIGNHIKIAANGGRGAQWLIPRVVHSRSRSLREAWTSWNFYNPHTAPRILEGEPSNIQQRNTISLLAFQTSQRC